MLVYVALLNTLNALNNVYYYTVDTYVRMYDVAKLVILIITITSVVLAE